VFLPQSDVFAEGPPPPRELFVVRELRVGFGKHFPKRHVSGKSRQHKSAQKENGQEGLWHAIILRIPTAVAIGKRVPDTLRIGGNGVRYSGV
jgi:hypothetical protein